MSRIISIIMTDLATDILKNEEAMENTINSKELDINTKIETIKHHLSKIVELEKMIEKWRKYTSQENNND